LRKAIWDEEEDEKEEDFIVEIKSTYKKFKLCFPLAMPHRYTNQ